MPPSILLPLLLALLSFFVQFITGANAPQPGWPLNIALLLSLCCGVVIAYPYTTRRHPPSSPAFRNFGFVSFLIFLCLVILAGIIPQTGQAIGLLHSFGLDRIVGSWPFVSVSLSLLISLGISSLQLCLNLEIPLVAKLSALLAHLGSLILLSSILFGARDLVRLKLVLSEGEESSVAMRGSEPHFLPFSIQLQEFHLEVYPPELLIVDNLGRTQPFGPIASWPITKANQSLQISDIEVTPLIVMENAIRSGSQYFPCLTKGACKGKERHAGAAIYLKWCAAQSTCGEGWVFQGAAAEDLVTLRQDKELSFGIAAPRPKLYRSKVRIRNKAPGSKIGNSDMENFELEVNRPIRLGSWTIYQLDYDKSKGRLSNTSVLEIVYDHWLRPIYFGLGLLFCSSLLMLGTRKRGSCNDRRA